MTIDKLWKVIFKRQSSPISYSYLKHGVAHVTKRIVVWNILLVLLAILIICGLLSALFPTLSFLPAFVLLAVYGTLLVVDVRRFQKYQKALKNFKLNFQTADDRINTFLQKSVKVKPVQEHDVSVVDSYGNHLIIFLMKKEWLVETYYIDDEFPTYHSFSFEKFPKKINWFLNGKDKQPRWHEAVEKLKPFTAIDQRVLERKG